MKYDVAAYWKCGIIGWLVANTTGKYSWRSSNDTKDPSKIWMFENPEDAMLFRLKFGK